MPSLRAAIDAKCRECSYDRLDRGTWRQQVADCRVPSCPLYAVRPQPTVSRQAPRNGQIGSISKAREGLEHA
jgi:hypothetical protein